MKSKNGENDSINVTGECHRDRQRQVQSQAKGRHTEKGFLSQVIDLFYSISLGPSSYNSSYVLAECLYTSPNWGGLLPRYVWEWLVSNSYDDILSFCLTSNPPTVAISSSCCMWHVSNNPKGAKEAPSVWGLCVERFMGLRVVNLGRRWFPHPNYGVFRSRCGWHWLVIKRVVFIVVVMV